MTAGSLITFGRHRTTKTRVQSFSIVMLLQCKSVAASIDELSSLFCLPLFARLQGTDCHNFSSPYALPLHTYYVCVLPFYLLVARVRCPLPVAPTPSSIIRSNLFKPLQSRMKASSVLLFIAHEVSPVFRFLRQNPLKCYAIMHQ